MKAFLLVFVNCDTDYGCGVERTVVGVYSDRDKAFAAGRLASSALGRRFGALFEWENAVADQFFEIEEFLIDAAPKEE